MNFCNIFSSVQWFIWDDILEIELCVHLQAKAYSVESSQWRQSLYLNMIVNKRLRGWIVFREPAVFMYHHY
jgi:hypothetical protein